MPLAFSICADITASSWVFWDLSSNSRALCGTPMKVMMSAISVAGVEAVSPIHNYSTGTGIPIYVIRGNHEDGYADLPLPAILEAYLATVASGMPLNGPPGEEKLTYSFTYKGAKFIAIDEYIPHNGIKNTMNQSWVDGQLTQDTRPFMFVMGHSPAYYVSNDTEDITTSLQVQPAQRDIFWKSLADNHVPIYFCGHVHMYVRGESQGVQQVIGGDGGAPFLSSIRQPSLRHLRWNIRSGPWLRVIRNLATSSLRFMKTAGHSTEYRKY